jgi:hypothetical protein
VNESLGIDHEADMMLPRAGFEKDHVARARLASGNRL